MRQRGLDHQCLRLTFALLWLACLPLSGQSVAARASRLGSESGNSRPIAAGLLTTALPYTPTGGQAAAPRSGYHAADAATVISWLRVDAANPMIVFVAGYGDCDAPDPEFGTVCKPWFERSADGGSRWTQLRPTTSFDPDLSQNSRFAAIRSSTDGHYLYMEISGGVSSDSNYTSLLTSSDGGLTWHEAGDIALPAVSPLSSARAYGVSGASEVSFSGCCMGLAYSIDGGAKWHPMALPTGLQQAVGTLVADAGRLNTAYFNANSASYLGGEASSAPSVVFRTDDLGAHWTTVMTPTATPPLGSFFVSTDPHEGKTLVGQTVDSQVPADRRYLSSDEGRTWTVGTCPGDWRGTCPAFTVDNAFGKGASYAFVSNGIYVFHGSGPAERAIAIGARLPVPLADILDVQAGAKYGQPVYILSTQVRGGVTGVIYRTVDQRRTWQRLSGPNTAAIQ